MRHRTAQRPAAWLWRDVPCVLGSWIKLSFLGTCGVALGASCAGSGVAMECGGAQLVPADVPVLKVERSGGASPPDALVVFGDSLSDTGALRAQSLGIAPNPDAYFGGRFSNGPVWVDHVGDALGVGSQSHAYGGAATRGDAGATPKPFDAAVREYLRCAADAPDALSPDTVFALWIGHNDYYQGATDPHAVAGVTLDAIDALAGRGARRFLVPDVLPLTGTPRPVRESAGEIDDATADARVAEHNAALLEGLTQRASHGELTIAHAHPGQMRARVLENPALLGLTNTEDACYSGDVYWLTGGSAEVCATPDTFFFWDGVHPSARVHCAYAVEMLRALGEAGIVAGTLDEEAMLQSCRQLSGRISPQNP